MRSFRWLTAPKTFLYSRVGVLLVQERPDASSGLRFTLVFYLQNATFDKWAMLGSNQRPLPCEGSALPLS